MLRINCCERMGHASEAITHAYLKSFGNEELDCGQQRKLNYVIPHSNQQVNRALCDFRHWQTALLSPLP